MITDYISEIEKAAELATQKPSDFGYWGSDDMFITWGFSGIDQHRDSDTLALSNFKVISNDLMSKFPDDFRIETYNHWAVGYVDRLVCRIYTDDSRSEITPAFYAAMEWQNALLDYPVADDSHLSEMEYEDNIDSLSYFCDDHTDIITVDHESDYDVMLRILLENSDWESVNDDHIYLVVYELGYVNMENSEFWEDWCRKNGKPTPNSAEYLANKDKNQLKLL